MNEPRGINADSNLSGPDLPRPPVVELDYEFVDPRNVDTVALEQAVIPLRELPLSGNIRVVVTSQMSKSLGARVDSSYSDPFQQKRIIGRVTAKTVTDQSSSTEILVDACALQPDALPHLDGSLHRLLSHEGRHLVLRDRSEDAHSCVRALSFKDPSDEATAWIAALAVEEYRIEAALCEEGEYGIPYDEQLPAAVEDWHNALVRAGNEWGSGKGMTVLGLANEVVTRSAYVAAAHHYGRPLDETTTGTNSWCLIMGPAWTTFVGLTEAIPSADLPMSAKRIAESVLNVGVLVTVWCAQLGFEILSDEAGLYLWPLNVVAASRPAA